ncbi:MAG: AMP phosphorylase [Thermoplasmatota archaeon]
MTRNPYQVKVLDIDLGKYQVILNRQDSETLGVHTGDRVKALTDDDSVTALVDTTETVVPKGTVGVFLELQNRLDLSDGDVLYLQPTERPASVQFIRDKMRGRKLGKDEIDHLVLDVVDGALSDVELSAWVTSLEINGMDMDEVEALTRSMVKYGETLEFNGHVVFDKHSIGGVPGNKITLLIVPIAAAEGLLIPKTSSRAVTGAAGTADVMECFGPVNLTGEEIKRITLEHGGVMCWGGGVNLAPADDIIIRVEHPLSIDPPAQLIASVMAKKKAVGANKVVMDLPMGEGTKLPDLEAARSLARQFIELGERLDMEVECAVTYGGQPVGKAVGCALEANEALMALRNPNAAPKSLIEKSTALAGMILEMGGVVPRGKGKQRAMEVLQDGRALAKFIDIVQAQGGQVPKGDFPIGPFKAELPAPEGGYVSGIKNKALIHIARATGSPRDRGAGLMVSHKRGDKIEAGETMLTLFAETESQLASAVALAKKLQPVKLEGMVLQRIPDFREIA